MFLCPKQYHYFEQHSQPLCIWFVKKTQDVMTCWGQNSIYINHKPDELRKIWYLLLDLPFMCTFLDFHLFCNWEIRGLLLSGGVSLPIIIFSLSWRIQSTSVHITWTNGAIFDDYWVKYCLNTSCTSQLYCYYGEATSVHPFINRAHKIPNEWWITMLFRMLVFIYALAILTLF